MSDLIDRQAAIDAFESADIERKGYALNDYEFGFNSGLSRAVDIIEDLPSAQPQRTGRWLKISPAGIYECSECGKNVMTADIDAYDFCHGCGAKMEVE